MANPTIIDLSLMNEWARRADLGEFLSTLDSRLKKVERPSGASDISELQRQVSALGERVTTLEGTVSSNGQKLTTVEGTANKNTSDISGANEKITALEGRVKALEGPSA